VGDYSGTVGSATAHSREIDERHAEEVLQAVVNAVQDRVRQSTGLKDTSFYSMPIASDDLAGTSAASGSSYVKVGSYKKRKFTKVAGWCQCRAFKANAPGLSHFHFSHGQYRSPALKPLSNQDDSHHAPVNPQEYIRWRLLPTMTFYQRRIPKYAFRRRNYQYALVIASLCSTLLAALERPNWTAIVASVSGSIAAWQEFVGLAQKLDRYSGASSSLGNILMWWQALPEVDQSNMKKQTLEQEEGDGGDGGKDRA